MIILIWSVVIGTLSSSIQLEQGTNTENELSKGSALAVANHDSNELNALLPQSRIRRAIFTGTALALGALGAKVGAKYGLKYGAKYGLKYGAKYAAKYGIKYGAKYAAKRYGSGSTCHYIQKSGFYLAGYPKSTGRTRYSSLAEAKRVCNGVADCGGVTWYHRRYELRHGNYFIHSPLGHQEISYRKIC